MLKNYNEAVEILKKISSAQKILLVLHKSPDLDSIGSNLALARALKGMGKNVQVISFDKPTTELNFLSGFAEILQGDISVKNLASYELLIILDAATPQMLTRSENFAFVQGLNIINIDHHVTNLKYGILNLIAGEIGSTAEIIYALLTSWGIEIDKETADCLLAGIIGDTGCFKYTNGTSPDTLRIGAELLDKGADFSKIITAIYQTVSVDTLKYWAKVLDKFEIRTSGNYTYCFCFLQPEDVYRWPKNIRSGAVGMFFQSVDGTDFGIVAEIDETGVVSGSLRARTNIDVAMIAEALGGGGHRAAAGFSFKLNPGQAEEAQKKILQSINTVLENA